MGNSRDGVMMAYNVQSAVDSKTHIILDFDVSLNPTDQHQLGNMVKKVKNRFHLKGFTVLADKGYYNGEDLVRVKRYKVKALVSRQRGSNPKDQPEAYHTDKFQYDKTADCYSCPAGKSFLRTTRRMLHAGIILIKSSAKAARTATTVSAETGHTAL